MIAHNEDYTRQIEGVCGELFAAEAALARHQTKGGHAAGTCLEYCHEIGMSAEAQDAVSQALRQV